jgi:putative membrane protein
MFGTGFCNGMGVGGWVLMIGFWAAFLGLVVWALTRMFPTDEPLRDAQQTLDQRLATGEIDPATYRAVRDELTGAGRP